MRQGRKKARRVQVQGAQREDNATQIGDGGNEHGLQFIQRGAHDTGSRIGQVRPERRFVLSVLSRQSGQTLRHAIAHEIVGDTEAFRYQAMDFCGTKRSIWRQRTSRCR